MQGVDHEALDLSPFPAQPTPDHLPTTAPMPPSRPDDNASVFSSNTTAPLLPSTDEFSFTGRSRQLSKPGSALASLNTGDAGFAGGAAGSAGANVAPRKFTGGSVIKVPVRKADLVSSGQDDAVPQQKEKKGLFSLKKGKKEDLGFVMVPMSSDEYKAFFAKGDDGAWLPDVVEPPGGRAEWVRKRMEEEG
ncbi:hypothetical protein ANO11243_043410 [Dothideomycetidae sp. 11243]|nr:hypothetical protein ANO11243_043410 [fungal sp. No.11243]